MYNYKGRSGFMITSVNVANNFIRKAESENIPITPLKLQKLVYFIYKEYLQDTGTELFSERFETWKYGPVLPNLYSEFRVFGNKPITEYERDSKNNIFVVRERGNFYNAFIKT